jgi:hypothetical protein
MSGFFQNIARMSFEWAYAAVSQLFAEFGTVNIVLTLVAFIALIFIFRVIHRHRIK